MAQVGFYGAVRYTALLIGILLAASCALVKARLPRKKWDPNLKWFDVGLLKEKQFALYTFGSFMVMFVCPSGLTDLDVNTMVGGGYGHLLASFLSWLRRPDSPQRWRST